MKKAAYRIILIKTMIATDVLLGDEKTVCRIILIRTIVVTLHIILIDSPSNPRECGDYSVEFQFGAQLTAFVIINSTECM